MENQKSNSNLKAIVIVLFLLLLGSLGDIFKMSTDAEIVRTELKTTLTEKESVMKDLQELKLERLVALADIENWLMLVEPFVEKFVVKPTAVKPVKPSRTVPAPAPPVIIETDEDIEFAKRHMDRAVEYVDILLGQLGSSLLLEDGPICEKGMFKKMYMSVITKLIEAKMLEEKLKETTMTKELSNFSIE
jgi:hypothetical protein